jgi:hypothetical protein
MADIWMDVDIAIAEAPVNLMPLIDDTDFKTIEDAVLYSAPTLIWHFVTTAGVQTETAVTPTTAGVHDWVDQGTSGCYALEIPASGGTINNDTEGFGWFTGVATGVLPWRGPVIGFRAAALNNTLIDDASSLLTGADVGLMYESAITTVTSQTAFIMTTAFATDDSWIGCEVSLGDESTGQFYAGNIWISDAVQSTETLHVNTAFPVTVVAGDIIRVHVGQHPTYAATLYDAATGTEQADDTASILAKLLAYVRLMTRSDAGPTADNAAELTEINANDGSGAGNYVAADSLEGQADKLPAALSNGTIDANIVRVTDIAITGTGTSIDPWGP